MDARRLIALAALGLLAACGSTTTATDPAVSPAPSTAASASPSGGPVVVPWADLPPGHQTIPSRTAPGSPDPATAEAAPPCRPGQVAISFSDTDASAGSAFADLTVRKLTGPDCSVAGTPLLAFSDDGVRNGVRSHSIPAAAGDYSHPVLLTATATARATVVWNYAVCEFHNRLLVADHVTATLGGGVNATTRVWASRGGHSVRHGKVQIGCFLNAADGKGHGIERVGVGALEPTDLRSAPPATAWSGIDVTPRVLRLSGEPRKPLGFELTLTARKDVSLGACPDYRLLMAGDRVERTDIHQLNCAAVPYRDATGAPYLPAGVPVTFAMQTTAPARPAEKVIWELDDGASTTLLVPGPVAAGSYTPQATPAPGTYADSFASAMLTVSH